MKTAQHFVLYLLLVGRLFSPVRVFCHRNIVSSSLNKHLIQRRQLLYNMIFTCQMLRDGVTCVVIVLLYIYQRIVQHSTTSVELTQAQPAEGTSIQRNTYTSAMLGQV